MTEQTMAWKSSASGCHNTSYMISTRLDFASPHRKECAIATRVLAGVLVYGEISIALMHGNSTAVCHPWCRAPLRPRMCHSPSRCSCCQCCGRGQTIQRGPTHWVFSATPLSWGRRSRFRTNEIRRCLSPWLNTSANFCGRLVALPPSWGPQSIGSLPFGCGMN